MPFLTTVDALFGMPFSSWAGDGYLAFLNVFPFLFRSGPETTTLLEGGKGLNHDIQSQLGSGMPWLHYERSVAVESAFSCIFHQSTYFRRLSMDRDNWRCAQLSIIHVRMKYCIISFMYMCKTYAYIII